MKMKRYEKLKRQCLNIYFIILLFSLFPLKSEGQLMFRYTSPEYGMDVITLFGQYTNASGIFRACTSGCTTEFINSVYATLSGKNKNNVRSSAEYYSGFYERCPDYINGDNPTPEQFQQYLNSLLPITLMRNLFDPDPGDWTDALVTDLSVGCELPHGSNLVFNSVIDINNIIVIPPTISACFLDNANIQMEFASSTLNTDGKMAESSLYVNCTIGDPQDYQLSLIGLGGKVTNGRLDFGNGVSAQISLNGTPLQANGPSINLNRLTSQTIPITAVLSGTAESSGVSNTMGVLILNAQ